MLGLATIGVVLSTVLSQDLVGVNYSFDVDFERTFNNKTCVAGESWSLVDYSTLSITLPGISRNGIRSKESSCTSSFPIVFFKDSFLELNIYLELVAERSGLVTTIFDDNNKAILTYVFNKSDHKFRAGWSTYSIEINTNVTGYINLIGHSRDDEIILVDSFRYITNQHQNVRTSRNYQVYEADSALIEDIHEPSDLLFYNEGSGDEIDGSGEEWDFLIGEDIEDEDDIDEKGVTKIEE